jgi:hypothetical protein
MLQSLLHDDSLAALARDSARRLLQQEGVDLRYFPEAWFFLGLAVSIFAWCWRTWRELHGSTPDEARPAAGPPRAAPVEGTDRLLCPACDGVVGDTRAPLGYLTVCPACGRPIDVRMIEGRPRVGLRE